MLTGLLAGYFLNSIKTLATNYLTGEAAQIALYRGCGFPLAFLGGLFVELPAARFGQYSGFLTRALKPSKGVLEWLIFTNFYTWH